MGALKIICGTCKRETNHSVLHEEVKRYDDDSAGTIFIGNWQIVQCLGCETISFREVWTDSDTYDDEGNSIESVNLYPKRQKGMLLIKSFNNAPLKIRTIYRETIDAYNNGMFILCTGGLRAIIDGLCIAVNVIDGPVEQKLKDGTKKIVRRKELIGKINGLHENGHLTKAHAEILNEHRFLGNSALHSLETPTNRELKIAIEIIEHTIENIFEISELASELRSGRKKREATK